jgi:hypothetical protein
VGTGRDPAAIQLEMQILSQQLAKVQTDRIIAEINGNSIPAGQIPGVGGSLDVMA